MLTLCKIKSAAVGCFLLITLLVGLGNSAFAEDEQQPQTLQEVWEKAYQTSPSLAAARAELRTSNEQITIALSGYRPTLAIDAQGGKSFTNVQDNSYYPDTVELKPAQMALEVSQPVFKGFETTARVRGAKAAIMAQRAAFTEVEQQLLFDAGQAFLDVYLAEQILGFTQENEQVLETQLTITQDRRCIGELKETDVAQSRARYKASSVSRLQAQRDLANKRRTFERLIGEPPSFLLEEPTLIVPEIESEDALFALVLELNPSVKRANYQLEAARAGITQSESQLWPKVSLSGQIARAWDQSITLTDRQDSASVTLRISIPLYQSGEEYARIRSAQHAKAQKAYEEDDVKERVGEKVKNAWENYKTARESIEVNIEVLDAAEQALVGVREESKVGTRTILDVLNAEQERVNAQINLARARHDEALAILQLEAMQGTLTAKDQNLDVALYDPEEDYNKARGSWAGFAQNE